MVVAISSTSREATPRHNREPRGDDQMRALHLGQGPQQADALDIDGDNEATEELASP